MFLIFFLIIYFNKTPLPNLNEAFLVIEVKEKYAIIYQKGFKYLIYQGDYTLFEGNKIFIKGNVKELTLSSIPYDNSFNSYLINKNINYEIKIEELTYLKKSRFIYSEIISALTKKLKESRDYLNLLIFNNKGNELNEFYDNLVDISVVQLFVVSGFHLGLLGMIIDKFQFKFLKKENKMITSLILFIYVYLLKFSLSSLRAFLSYFFNYLNKRYNLKLTNLSISSFIGILFLLFNPFLIYVTSYKLSFLMVISLNILQSVKIDKKIKIFIPFLITLPFIINMNNKIGLINIFMNYLLTPVVSFLFIFGLVCLFIPFLDHYFYLAMINFEKVISYLKTSNAYLELPCVSYEYTFIYLSLIFLMLLIIYLRKKSHLKFVVSFMFIFLMNYLATPFDFNYVLFFDVGQGDSALIHKQNRNILIDTGGSIYQDYATKRLIPYFKKVNIQYLDLVIISHDDFDHNGALDSLRANFKVKNIVTGNDYEEIYYQDLRLVNLNNDYDPFKDDNDNSSVLYLEFMGLKFLFTGDASKEVEEKIVTNYDLDIDILKVGHHGSNSSTSPKFINKIKPLIAVISVGKNNKYGHPHKEVIQTLNASKCKILRTDLNGSIKIEKRLGDIKIYLMNS